MNRNINLTKQKKVAIVTFFHFYLKRSSVFT